MRFSNIGNTVSEGLPAWIHSICTFIYIYVNIIQRPRLMYVNFFLLNN